MIHHLSSRSFLLTLTLALLTGQHRSAAADSDWLIHPESYPAKVASSADKSEIELSNGLLKRTIRLKPDAATVSLDLVVTGESLLRGVKPEAILEIDGQRYDVGGLQGQPNYAFLRPEWVDQLKPSQNAFHFVGSETGKPLERFGWKRTRHHSKESVWPPKGVTLRLDFEHKDLEGIRVSVHYELYDGLPCYSKWLTVRNNSKKPIRIDRFSSERLAIVERVSEVDELSEGKQPPNLHVETDMSFGGMMASELIDAPIVGYPIPTTPRKSTTRRKLLAYWMSVRIWVRRKPLNLANRSSLFARGFCLWKARTASDVV